MTKLHQETAPWALPMEAHAAITLQPTAEPRWLRVDEGCVWVTARDGGPYAPDHWLGAGESMSLSAGSAWVVQAWPQARLSLLLAQPTARRAAASSRAWWQSSWIWPWVLAGGKGGQGGRCLPA